jgi:hypothetical protein
MGSSRPSRPPFFELTKTARVSTRETLARACFESRESARERGTESLYSEPRRSNDHGRYVDNAGPSFFHYKKTPTPRHHRSNTGLLSITSATNQLLEQTRLKMRICRIRATRARGAARVLARALRRNGAVRTGSAAPTRTLRLRLCKDLRCYHKLTHILMFSLNLHHKFG